MAKKLILLILIIPIVVIIALWGAIQAADTVVDIPVSGIDILEPYKSITINMDTEDSYSLEYAVTPVNAHNKTVIPSYEAVEGKDDPELEFVNEDGKIKIIPNAAGEAKLYLTTASMSRKASIGITVKSTALKSIDCSVPKTTLTVGEKTTVETVFNPENASNALVEYTSSNDKIASVNQNGVITAKSRGVATITVTSEFDSSIKDTIKITVKNKDAMDLGESEIKMFGTSGSIPISIASDDAISASNISYTFIDTNGNAVPNGIIEASVNITDNVASLDYAFTDTSFVGDIIAKITFKHGDVTITKECLISRVQEIFASFDSENAFKVNVEQTLSVPFTVVPNDVEVEYSVSADANYVNARINNGKLRVTGTRAGVTKVTLTVKTTSEPIQTKTIEKEIIINPTRFDIEETYDTYGIENLLTVGKDSYSYENNTPALVDTYGTENAFLLHYLAKDDAAADTLGQNFAEHVRWISSHPDKVYIDENGKIQIKDASFIDTVEFHAEFFSGETVYMTTGKMKIRCVGNAVNVYSYKDLYYATEGEFPVVLHKDIKDDFGYIDGTAMYTEIHTTYDDTYYKNIGKLDDAKVKVLISFRNSIYGNGHIINADNLTNMLEADDLGIKHPTADALFKGPLNFVMATHTASGSTISVKGQDNICFALYEGVTVNNVELIGCDVDAIGGGTSQDLADLAYAGTVAEVLGDNVNIEYSRLTNGRTVLRAFGDIENDEKQINVSIKNSVLSGAREFIMRIGSNRFVKTNETSPYLENDNSDKKEYETKEVYNSLTNEEKSAYDSKYINTFITVKNSVFQDAGLFAIGMDSHFAGRALRNGNDMISDYPQLDGLLKGWYDLAKTSYGAKIKFEETVGLYSWKDVKALDSSTLIEVTGNFDIFNQMTFKVQDYIETVSKTSGYESIVKMQGGKSMVHSGIAFFGGGKNYSVFEYDAADKLYPYEISFETISRPELQLAAGEESFYFFIYDANASFSPAVQEQKLADGSAYDCINKK